jgi:hypothetical protein
LNGTVVGPSDRLTERAGRVVDRDGSPVPHARIVIVAAPVPMPEIALVADEQGRFSLRLPPGAFTLRAHGPSGTGEAELESPTGSDEVVIAIGG